MDEIILTEEEIAAKKALEEANETTEEVAATDAETTEEVAAE